MANLQSFIYGLDHFNTTDRSHYSQSIRDLTRRGGLVFVEAEWNPNGLSNFILYDGATGYSEISKSSEHMKKNHQWGPPIRFNPFSIDGRRKVAISDANGEKHLVAVDWLEMRSRILWDEISKDSLSLKNLDIKKFGKFLKAAFSNPNPSSGRGGFYNSEFSAPKNLETRVTNSLLNSTSFLLRDGTRETSSAESIELIKDSAGEFALLVTLYNRKEIRKYPLKNARTLAALFVAADSMPFVEREAAASLLGLVRCRS